MGLPPWPSSAICVNLLAKLCPEGADLQPLAAGIRRLGWGRREAKGRWFGALPWESRPEAWPLKAAGGQILGFPHPCRSGGGQDFTSALSYFVDRVGGRQGNPWLITACLCGGMSGMFGIWVFTSQGAHGSLVLKCGFFISLWGLLWAWIVAFKPRAAAGCCKAVSPFLALSPLHAKQGG